MSTQTKPHGATLSAARNLAAVLMMSAAASATSAAAKSKADAASKPAATEAAAIEKKVFDKLLTKCGDSYFYAGSGFDFEGMEPLLPQPKGLTKTEYRQVRFTRVGVPLSPGQRMNGIQQRFRIAFIAGVYKTGEDDIWNDGPGRNPANMHDIFAKVIAAGLADSGRMGSGGAIALEIVQYDGGKWAVGRSSVNLSGPVGTDRYFTLEGVLAAPTPRVDCATGAIKF